MIVETVSFQPHGYGNVSQASGAPLSYPNQAFINQQPPMGYGMTGQIGNGQMSQMSQEQKQQMRAQMMAQGGGMMGGHGMGMMMGLSGGIPPMMVRVCECVYVFEGPGMVLFRLTSQSDQFIRKET